MIAPRRILIVEDNPITRKMMRVALEVARLGVLEAGDAREALELVTTTAPDLIVQDLHLPDIDGIELCKSIRATVNGRDVPIVAISGLQSKLDEARSLDDGFCDFLYKPVEPSRLVDTIKAHLPAMPEGSILAGQNRRILLVDDEIVQRKLNAMQLEQIGFQVTTAADGVEGLALARETIPDAIVADVLMPRLNGLEMCLAVRQDPQLASVPVVLTSSTLHHLEEADRQMAQDVGANTLVSRTPGFLEAVRALLTALDAGPPPIPNPDASSLAPRHFGRFLRQIEMQGSLNETLAERAALDTVLLAIATSASSVLTRKLDLQQVLDETLAHALNAGGVSAGIVYLMDGTGRLELRAQIGHPSAAADSLGGYLVRTGLLLRITAQGRPMQFPGDGPVAAEVAELLLVTGARSLLIAPLVATGETLGALVMMTGERVVGSRWLSSIGVVAAHLAQAVALSRMVEATAVRARLAELNADVSAALAISEGPRDMLRRCTEAIVRNLGASFARIWTLNDAEQVLELQASSGIYTHLNGRHSRVPVGQFKIGLIAKERLPHITNTVIGDPRVSDQEWARREGMVAFAGYPLIVEDRVLGVMGMFAAHALTSFTISALGSIAEVISVGIIRQRNEDRIRQLTVAVEQSPAAMLMTDTMGSIEYVNESFTRMTGFTAAEVLGRNPRLLRTVATPAEEYQRLWATITGGGQWRGVLQNRRKNGEVFWNAVSISPIRDASGTISKFIAVGEDVTERKRSEDAIRETTDRFLQVTEHIKEAFYLIDLTTGRNLYVSPTFEEIWGFSLAEVYARPQAWFEAVHPEDQPRMKAALDANARGEVTSTEFRVTGRDGGTRWVRARSFPVRDASGRVYRLAGVSEDITQERNLEAQFGQSQKMEAVGRLAGGVAHDFNNLLTVITGYVDLGVMGLRQEDPLRRNLQEIRKAAERAATLTRQLLAFSRQQVLAPRVLDLNMLVLGIEKMLHRLLGEDVELESSLSPDLGRIHADAGQLEQVLVNLAVNARDAMPDGGKLTIETANLIVDESRAQEMSDVPAGHYVTLSVTDTGYGMDEDTRTRMFEPFFTTKAEGKGTGLGLSTVYGIVNQSGGCVRVCSEPGRGTTFKIYLPYLEAVAEPTGSEVMKPEVARGTETVLLVEDEEAVRAISQTALTQKGYRVLTAANGREAMLMSAQAAGPIQLLITDMVMPGVGGPELARRLGPLRPEMKVLFVSGYADRAVERQNEDEPKSAFLEKPFSIDALTLKVREVLDTD